MPATRHPPRTARPALALAPRFAPALAPRFAPALALALALAGCSERDATGREAGRLIVAFPRDGGPVNPYSGPGDNMLGLVYDKLFEPSPYVPEPWPALATGAQALDSLTWLVTLRPGVRWHDGRPFTADDVAFTFAYYRDGPPNRFGHHVSDVPRIDGVDVLDSLTVRFRCGWPCPALRHITLADLPILPRHEWEGVTDPRTLERLPVGTGPYRLVEYVPGQRYRFAANADYALGRPVVDELVLPILTDASAAFLALRTGQVDAVARAVPPELIAGFESAPGLRVVSSTALSIAELRPNWRAPPFDDPAVRRALALAVDRDELVERVLLGRGLPGDRGYPHPASPWTDPQLRTPHDAAEAAALLDAAGLADRDRDGAREGADGAPLRWTLLVDAGETTRVRAAQLVARQLGRLGIAVHVVALEAGAFTERVRARDFDLFVSEIGAHGAADPDQFAMSHRSGYLWDPAVPFPEWDERFARWQAATTVEARRAAGFELQRLFNDRPTSIALYYPEEYWAYRPAAFDGWLPAAGQGIVHKGSLVAWHEDAPAATGAGPARPQAHAAR